MPTQKFSSAATAPNLQLKEREHQVLILPPRVQANEGYVILANEPRFGYVTIIGSVIAVKQVHHAAQFATAREAIEFAERCGWHVVNQDDNNSVWY